MPTFLTIPFLYSYCAKTTFLLEKAINDLIFAKLYMLCCILSRVAELVIYIVIFMKQTEIEQRASLYVIKNNEPISIRR